MGFDSSSWELGSSSLSCLSWNSWSLSQSSLHGTGYWSQ
jgi:hypothetical protein